MPTVRTPKSLRKRTRSMANEPLPSSSGTSSADEEVIITQQDDTHRSCQATTNVNIPESNTNALAQTRPDEVVLIVNNDDIPQEQVDQSPVDSVAINDQEISPVIESNTTNQPSNPPVVETDTHIPRNAFEAPRVQVPQPSMYEVVRENVAYRTADKRQDYIREQYRVRKVLTDAEYIELVDMVHAMNRSEAEAIRAQLAPPATNPEPIGSNSS